MKRIVTVTSIKDLADCGLRNIVITCGVFDGVHRGHAQLVSQLCALAKEKDSAPVVVTFDPHPRAVLNPNNPPQLLTCREQKTKQFFLLGVAAIVFIPFSKELADLSPADFFSQYLLNNAVNIHGICVGNDWRFGKYGVGDTKLLAEYGKEFNFSVDRVSEVMDDDDKISSTTLRNAVQNGDLRTSQKLLGRPYTVFGHVSHGKGIGSKTFHCPTANLCDRQIILPPNGVYAARADLQKEGCEVRIFRGIVYVGKSPTIKEEYQNDHSILELHLFDFSDDLYGNAIEVEFVKFIRSDREFPSTEALRIQIKKDIAVAKGLV